jgi:spore coat polysaccharide biosynthesis protein SpsF
MKVGIIVICRYNSSRLPGKILKEINGKPLLSYILERLQQSKYHENIVIATSDEETDQPIVDYCQQHKVPYFRGDLKNVSLRFAKCMQFFNFDYGVRINGDNIFTDPQLVDQAIDLALKNDYDIVSNVKGRTFPTGMSVEVVSSKFYNEQIHKFSEERHLEHVTLYFYENEKAGNFCFFTNEEMEEAKGLKMAVDTQNDFTFVSSIIKKMDKPHFYYDWKAITKIYLNEK